MGVGAADPEGGDTGAAGVAGSLPGPGLGEQFHRSGRPVHVRRRLLHVQRPGQHPVPHRHHHLDHAGHTRGRLGVPDVRLDRPQPQGCAVVRPVPAVGGEQGVGLDRVAEDGAGAVGLDGVDFVGAHAGGEQRVLHDAALRRSVGCGQPVGGAVLVDRRPSHDGEHLVPVAAGVGEAFEQDQAHSFGPAGAVGRRRERLAAAVGGQRALPAELHEDVGGAHHRGAAGDGEGALSAPQGGARQVDGDQGGGTGGVDGDGGPLEAERVRDSARQYGGRVADHQVALDVLGHLDRAGVVVVVHGAGEDAGAGVPQGERVDARAFQGLPGEFQQQSLLRVHRQGLARVDAEEGRVEVGDVVQEAPGAGQAGAGGVRVGAVESVQVPPPVGGERGHRVAAVGDQLPQFVGGAHSSRHATAHADDGDRLVLEFLGLAQAASGLAQVRRGASEIVAQLLVVRRLVGHRSHRFVRYHRCVRARARCRGPGTVPRPWRPRDRRRAGRPAAVGRRGGPARCGSGPPAGR